MLGADCWQSPSQPMHVQQNMQSQVPAHMIEADAAGLERHHMQMDQLVQCATPQHAWQQNAGGEFFQQVMEEIAKRCMVDGTTASCRTAMTGTCPQAFNTGLLSKEDSFSSDQRVEELNQYIRQQSREYIEGQAEWSRQIAEVRSELLRELDKVKRDKDEVERQARQEILRLQQKIREAGLKDEGPAAAEAVHGTAEHSSRSVGAWAAGVSMDEYQQLHKKYTAAEDRIMQLEQYIKDQSTKHFVYGDAQPQLRDKDEEIQRLKSAILSSGTELRQVTTELQALRAQHQQKMLIWEQGARRMMVMSEQFLNQGCRTVQRPPEDDIENGRFGRTATKLSLTLSQGEGGDVNSLRRYLRDVLKNEKEKSAKKVSQKSKDEGKAEDPALVEPVHDEQRKGEEVKLDEARAGEGECSTLWSPSGPPGSTALSDSNPSSRDTSPGRGTLQIVGRNGATQSSCSGAALNARVTQFVSQLLNDIRQLLALSQQGAPSGSFCNSPDASPRSVGSSPASSSAALTPPPSTGSVQVSDRAQINQLLESMAPARKGITQNIISVEKMLRSLDKELRKQCEEIFGAADLQALTPDSDTSSMLVEEAKRHVPASSDNQLVCLTGIRHAQLRSSAALAEFVQLPQKLKMVFDLTKKLASEVTGMVPVTTLHTAESQGTLRGADQRHGTQADQLQRRLQSSQPMSVTAPRTCELPLTPPQEASEEEEEAVAREIREELDRGVSHENQLLAVRTRLRHLSKKLASKDERLRNLEQEMVDLHLSRYNERAQCMAMLQQHHQQHQPAGDPRFKPPWWPWAPSFSGAPDVCDHQNSVPPEWRAPCQQAWGSGGHSLLQGAAEWPTATCVA